MMQSGYYESYHHLITLQTTTTFVPVTPNTELVELFFFFFSERESEINLQLIKLYYDYVFKYHKALTRKRSSHEVEKIKWKTFPHSLSHLLVHVIFVHARYSSCR